MWKMWVEINYGFLSVGSMTFTPLAGVWVEIQ